MSGNIALIHEEVFQFLLDKHELDNNFYFLPRKVNNRDRFNSGYWFIGDDVYLMPTFWQGGDVLRKIHHIGFTILNNGKSYLQLSSKSDTRVLPIFNEIINNIPGIEPDPRPAANNRWYKYSKTNDYMAELEQFLENDKPIIDDIVKGSEIKQLRMIEPAEYQKYINNIHQFRHSPNVILDEEKMQKELNNYTFGEFDGIKTYTVSQLRIVRAIHGKIIRELIQLLKGHNLNLGKDNLRDLYILDDKNKIKVLFELKTDISTSSIYCGLGQLLIYSKDYTNKPRLVFMLPEKLDTNLETFLKSIGIDILYYNFDIENEILTVPTINEYL